MRYFLPIVPLIIILFPLSKSDAEEVKLIYFYEKGCRWCSYMDDVLNDSSIRNILQRNTNIMKVNVHGSMIERGELTEKGLAKKYKINTVPTLIFLDSYGEELLRVPGALTKDDLKSLICDNLKELYDRDCI